MKASWTTFAIALCVAGFLATACTPDASPAETEVSAASLDSEKSTDTSTAPWTNATSEVKLEQGASYATVREHLLNTGWTPLPSRTCEQDVIGDGHEAVCKQGLSKLCSVCSDLPETTSCTSNGLCLMRFAGMSDEVLSLSTYGDITTWNAGESEVDVFIRGWELDERSTP